MSDALLAMIAKRRAQQGDRTKTVSAPDGRSRWKILPSWRLVKTAPPGIDPARWSLAAIQALAKGNSEAQSKLGAAAVNCPPGFSDFEKFVWMTEFSRDFALHWVKDAAGKVVAVHTCQSKTFGKPCSICDQLSNAIMRSPDDASKKRLEDATSKGRVLMNAVRIDTPGQHRVEILEVPPSVVFGKKEAGGIIRKMGDWPTLLSPTGGADVIIERAGKGMDTAYDVSIVPSSVDLDPGILAQMYDLDAYVSQGDAQSEQRAIAGVSAIAGVLPAPSRPNLSDFAGGAQFEDIPDLTSQRQSAPQQPTAPVSDMSELLASLGGQTQVQPTQEAPRVDAAQAAAPQPPTQPAGDDLDALLKGL